MAQHLKLRSALVVLVVMALLGSLALLPATSVHAISTPWLSVSGRYIKDPSGNNVILRGVSLIDVSVANTRTRNALAQIDMATNSADGWYARVVRLPVYPDAIDGQPGWNANPDAYFNNHLNPAIQRCIARQIYCIIDWHYIKDYNSSAVDTATRNFWSYVAPKYKDVPNVIFELYNEPIYPDSWSTWKTWAQPWVNLIRAAAPNNLILVGGPRWSQNVAEAATNPFSGAISPTWRISTRSTAARALGMPGSATARRRCPTSSPSGAGSRAARRLPAARDPGTACPSAAIWIARA